MKDWQCDQTSTNILESVATLIATEKDSAKSTLYLEVVLKKIIEPLEENISWITSA